jgi:cytochrome c oxidase subunit II
LEADVNSAPLAYLTSAGQRAHSIVPLTWFTLIVSVLVCVIIGTVLWLAVKRARASGGAEATRAIPVERDERGERWIGTGLLLSAPPLLITLVWTMVTLAAVSGPPRDPGLVLDVTGHQWWWEVTYQAAAPAQVFTTANEIHIPVNTAVLVRLHGGDVIHSFWVPQLSGKTDTIPGQTNLSWLEAQRPGRYRGQCSEYCGLQHAHMAFEVVAESRSDFERWRAHQLEPASAPVGDKQERGLALLQYRCGLCHQVRGTSAGSLSAPDLTHIASRRTIAAGLLPNTAGTLSGWIENAQGIKPGNLMPNQNLSSGQVSDVVAYLDSLQ